MDPPESGRKRRFFRLHDRLAAGKSDGHEMNRQETLEPEAKFIKEQGPWSRPSIFQRFLNPRARI
jgi:hypothetical protein